MMTINCTENITVLNTPKVPSKLQFCDFLCRGVDQLTLGEFEARRHKPHIGSYHVTVPRELETGRPQ